MVTSEVKSNKYLHQSRCQLLPNPFSMNNKIISFWVKTINLLFKIKLVLSTQHAPTDPPIYLYSWVRQQCCKLESTATFAMLRTRL